VLANLLQGRWPLADERLFEPTHLCWFTRESLGELVASCGLLPMGLRARRWVAGSRLQEHQTPEREAWYRSLWERREELTAQLLERVPELGP
jgi:hypothetical protein